MRTAALVVAAVVVGLAAGAWWFLPGEEGKVRARLEDLAGQLSIPAGESGLPRVTRAAGVRTFFAPDVTVELPPGLGQALHGRDDIAALVARVSVPIEGTKVELLDLDIDVAAEKTSADVRLNARVVTAAPQTEPQILDARMIALTLRKTDGVWLVASARVMPTDDSLGVR